MEGKNSARDGIKAINPSLMISTIQKGVTPLNIVETGTSLITPFKTKTFNPMGGVIKLISVTTTTKIPNQIRSKPSVCTNGAKIGTVRSIMDIDSNTHPNNIYIRRINKITDKPDSSK